MSTSTPPLWLSSPTSSRAKPGQGQGEDDYEVEESDGKPTRVVLEDPIKVNYQLDRCAADVNRMDDVKKRRRVWSKSTGWKTSRVCTTSSKLKNNKKYILVIFAIKICIFLKKTPGTRGERHQVRTREWCQSDHDQELEGSDAKPATY